MKKQKVYNLQRKAHSFKCGIDSVTIVYKNIKIQRDCYSAFLIMNVNEDLKSINRDKCIETYDNFKMLHDREISRLKELKLNGYKLILSMGI